MTFSILAALAAGAALTVATPDLPRPLVDEFDGLSVVSADNAALVAAERLADDARTEQDNRALRQLRAWSDDGNLWARIALARLIEEARVGERTAGEFLRLVDGLPDPMPPGTQAVTEEVVSGLRARAAAYRAFARQSELPETPRMTGVLPVSVDRRVVSPSERQGVLAEIPQKPVDLMTQATAASRAAAADAVPGRQRRASHTLVVGFAKTTADLLRAVAAASERSGAAMAHVIPEIHPIEHPEAGPGFFLALTGIKSAGQARTICALMRVRNCDASLGAGDRLQEKEARRERARTPEPASAADPAVTEPARQDQASARRLEVDEGGDGTQKGEPRHVSEPEPQAVPLPPPPKPVFAVGRVRLPEGMVVWRVSPAWQKVIRAGRGIGTAMRQIEGATAEGDYTRALGILAELDVETQDPVAGEPPAPAPASTGAMAEAKGPHDAAGATPASRRAAVDSEAVAIQERVVASVLGAAARGDQQFDFIKSMQIVGELGVDAYIPAPKTDQAGTAEAPGSSRPLADSFAGPADGTATRADAVAGRASATPAPPADAGVQEPAIEVLPAPEPRPLVAQPATDGHAIARLDAQMRVEPDRSQMTETRADALAGADDAEASSATGMEMDEKPEAAEVESAGAESADVEAAAWPAIDDPIALTLADRAGSDVEPALQAIPRAPAPPALAEVRDKKPEGVIARVSRHALAPEDLARLEQAERQVLARLDEMLALDTGNGIASGVPSGVFVQLASFRDSASAQVERDRLSGVLQDWLANRPLLEVRHLSGSTSYYAVILRGFEDRMGARNFCASIPARLTDCWVRGR